MAYTCIMSYRMAYTCIIRYDNSNIAYKVITLLGTYPGAVVSEGPRTHPEGNCSALFLWRPVHPAMEARTAAGDVPKAFAHGTRTDPEGEEFHSTVQHKLQVHSPIL